MNHRLANWGMLICACWLAFAEGRAQSTAVKLGYGPGDKLILIHADDVGMSHTVNTATIDALKHGMVTSASIMVPCAWFPEIADYAKSNPDLDLGLHLTLTSEWKYLRWRPVSPIADVPGLVDDQGFMWRSERQTAFKATPKEVETELRAQIDRALAFGIKPTHLDTHMGTLYTRKDFFEVYVKLGKEYRLPIMVMRATPEAIAGGKKDGSPITAEMMSNVEAGGLPVLDYLITGVQGKTFEERRQSYHDVLRNLKPGVTMLIVHLGLDTEELKATTGSWQQRYADFQTFTDPATKKLMAELGIRTTTWRELGKLARWDR